MKFRDILDENPIIGAIKTEKDLDKVLKTDVKIVFVLTSTVCTIEDIVNKIKSKGKYAIVHVDLIDGLANTNSGLEYLIKKTNLDGIISTKQSLIKSAKKQNLWTIQRFFILDSLSFMNSIKYARENKPDAIEILPGVMPKMIKRITNLLNLPVIAGGLISDKEDVVTALGAGALAISTTKSDVWTIN